jgi:hypothetical protein
MEMCGQLHALAILHSEKEHTALTGQEVGLLTYIINGSIIAAK